MSRFRGNLGFRSLISLSLVLCCALTFSVVSVAQLSQNSGINPNDTYIIADITLQRSGSAVLDSAVYDATVGANTTSMQIAPPDAHFHIEAGYDFGGNLLVNLFPTDTPADPTLADVDALEEIRLTQGSLVLIDVNNNTIPVPSSPSAPNLMQLLNMLGPAPATSVARAVVISDPSAEAQARSANLSYSSGARCTGCQSTQSATLTSHSSSAGGGNVAYTYQQSGSSWIISDVVVTPDTSDALNEHLNFSNVTYFDNSSADQSRATRGTNGSTPPTTSTNVQFDYSSYPAYSDNSVQLVSSTGQNIVFQHGLGSDHTTWNRMEPFLKRIFLFNKELLPDLQSLEPLSSQGTDLINKMIASNQTRSIVLGHSQGGLIARDVAQQRRDLASGVITLDTPNTGALFAYSSRVAVAQGLSKLLNRLIKSAGCSTADDNAVCFLAYLTASPSLLQVPVSYAFDSAAPATSDLIPGSSYLTRLNANTENFVSGGITGSAIKRFNLFRLVADKFSNPDDALGGRAVYVYAQIVYYLLRVSEYVALFFGDYIDAHFFATIANLFDKVDSFYNHLVSTGSDGSDAIVQASGQTYPHASKNYLMKNADSHVGSTKSLDISGKTISQAFDELFFVTHNPASCTYSLSPVSAFVPASGGQGFVSVTTQTGCPWSIIGLPTWASVNVSQAQGAGSFTYTAQPNTVTTPRSANISVQGQTFALSQAAGGSCTYSISPSDDYFDYTGGTDTVTVNTQTGCVWSAASQNGWLKITSGGSGTGPGSFNIQAIFNSRDSRSGSIKIANLTFTVTQDPNPDYCSNNLCL